MPEEQIEVLKQQIETLNRHLYDIGLSLKGSETLDIAGVYGRLKQAFTRLAEVEVCVIRTEELIRETKEELEDDFRSEFKTFRIDQEEKMNEMMNRIDKNSTVITAALMRIHLWESLFGLFKSKNFWRLAAIVFGSVALNKSWSWLAKQIEIIWESL